MNKFDFGRANDDYLGVRMTKRTADEIRKIAKIENVSIQEVCRQFLEVALNDYLAERAALNPSTSKQGEHDE